jgi:5-hydroxyisourate hydrolase-like protein (transthyretin family)
MFVIGDKKVVPNLSRKYKQGQEVGLYLQIYNSGIDQTTLRPAIDVEYDLSRIGGETRRIREDWTGMSESGQRLILARFIDTERLVPGEYKITIKIKDTVTGQSLEPVEQFFVIQ